LDRRTARARRAAELEGWEWAMRDSALAVPEALAAETEEQAAVAAKVRLRVSVKAMEE
jgi:hypothetical protein